jgi:predicted ATP-dependent Lon-type protease
MEAIGGAAFYKRRRWSARTATCAAAPSTRAGEGAAQEERFVGVPEQGGRDLISADPLAPGSIYTASVSMDGTVGLYRLEVSLLTGTGKLRLVGGVHGDMRESIMRAFSYLNSHKTALGVAREIDTQDFHVEVIDLLGNRVEAEVGVAFFVAAYSVLRKAPAQAGLMVLGDMSVQDHQADPLADRAATGRYGQRRPPCPDPRCGRRRRRGAPDRSA